MVKLLGEVKVATFLNSIMAQFPYMDTVQDDFMYRFQLNNAHCSMGYTKQKRLFAKTYHFTIVIEKVIVETSRVNEIRYIFHKNQWKSKTNSPLLKTANEQFLLNWSTLDLESLTITEIDKKRTFTMSVLPGSYTALLFPPLTQGIPLQPNEISTITNWIDTMTRILDSSPLNTLE